jgi:hypothetical protein
VLGDDSRDDRDLELSIRFRETNVSVREFAAYLSLLDGVYGRLTPRGYRSYALSQSEHLRIAAIRIGSAELQFIFDVFSSLEIGRCLLMYLVARVGPALIKGEIAKNWAEAAKAGTEAYQLWRPAPESLTLTKIDDDARSAPGGALKAAPPPIKLTRAQRNELNVFLDADPHFSKLSVRHRRDIVNTMLRTLEAQRQQLVAAQRFDEDSVIEVVLRRRLKG